MDLAREYFERSRTPDCSECDTKRDVDPGFEDAEREFISKVCGACPHGRPRDAYIEKLLYYLQLEDGTCPVGRYELLDHEWIDKGVLKAEWERLHLEAKKAATGGSHGR